MCVRLSNRLKVICIGANWMHPIERNSGVVEPERLWSWIILCDDGIPFHKVIFRITANLKQLLLSRSTKIPDPNMWTRNILKPSARTL